MSPGSPLVCTLTLVTPGGRAAERRCCRRFEYGCSFMPKEQYPDVSELPKHRTLMVLDMMAAPLLMLRRRWLWPESDDAAAVAATYSRP